jgi:hypothetical protein
MVFGGLMFLYFFAKAVPNSMNKYRLRKQELELESKKLEIEKLKLELEAKRLARKGGNDD